jgi:hypothetical protein
VGFRLFCEVLPGQNTWQEVMGKFGEQDAAAPSKAQARYLS